MQFTGEIVRLDESTEALYIESGSYGKVTMYFNAKLHTLQDGECMTINRVA